MRDGIAEEPITHPPHPRWDGELRPAVVQLHFPLQFYLRNEKKMTRICMI